MTEPDLEQFYKQTRISADQGSSSHRAKMLMGEDEDWSSLWEFWERKARGEDLRIVAWIWHGNFGSIRRRVDAHLERCAPPSRAVMQLRNSVFLLETGQLE